MISEFTRSFSEKYKIAHEALALFISFLLWTSFPTDYINNRRTNQIWTWAEAPPSSIIPVVCAGSAPRVPRA